MAINSTAPLRARTKLYNFMPCWYSSTLCACSHRADPVNFSRSQKAAIARYWYQALNSELICTLIARSTSACIKLFSPLNASSCFPLGSATPPAPLPVLSMVSDERHDAPQGCPVLPAGVYQGNTTRQINDRLLAPKT